MHMDDFPITFRQLNYVVEVRRYKTITENPTIYKEVYKIKGS